MARDVLAGLIRPPRRTEGWGGASGPLVARVFHRWLAAVLVVAFLSLGAQVDGLFGADGLSPIAPRASAFPPHATLASAPSWLRFWSTDVALRTGVVVGVASGVLALWGVLPRLLVALGTFTYLGYALLGVPFTNFQWDNMLVEVGFLAVFLSRRRPARLVHLLFVLLLIKLYFESGVAKWQSHLGDWHDGTAMTYYYETAPMPGWLGWQAHNLPRSWHVWESRLVLALELVVPWLALGPRRARLACFAGLTAFQVANLLTANYGFFVHLSLGLHLFLLEDRDLLRMRDRALRWLRAPPAAPPLPLPPLPRARRLAGAGLAGLVAMYWIGFSVLSGLGTFSGSDALRSRAHRLAHLYQRPRLVNDYHLFGHITRERVEPRIEILEGEAWRTLALRYQPGPLDRPPPLVAPHQPRVDFQLWFYGLGWRHGMPAWIFRLLERTCREASEASPVTALFETPPTMRPRAVRMSYWRYRMTTREERAATGRVWHAQHVSTGRAIGCPGAQSQAGTPGRGGLVPPVPGGGTSTKQVWISSAASTSSRRYP